MRKKDMAVGGLAVCAVWVVVVILYKWWLTRAILDGMFKPVNEVATFLWVQAHSIEAWQLVGQVISGGVMIVILSVLIVGLVMAPFICILGDK